MGNTDTVKAFALPDAQPVYSPAQLEARQQATIRRAAAMVRDFDLVLGVRVKAMTPATYSRLVVIGSPFLYRAAAGADAVRDYLWIHAETFDEEARNRAAFFRDWDRKTMPRWARWRYTRQTWHDRVATTYALAACEIAELVGIAFADEPPGGEGNTMAGASLEAQFIDVFADAYGWTPERTRNTPLRQLFQLLSARSRTSYDKDEAAVIAEELRVANLNVTQN